MPAWRQWCWYGGLTLMVATLISPLAHLSDELFFAHMVEHLLLADLGALLLVLGLTGPLLQPVLSAPGLRWLRVFAHPVVAITAWTANFYLWHLPVLYQGAVEHPAVHALQHILFVSFGIGMWMALLGPLPKPAWFGNAAKIGYIVAVRLIQSVLANALLWSGGVLYPRYAAGEALLGHHARQRPERGGRDHDGRGVDRHDPAVLLAVPARGAGERGEARRWSSWRRRAASSSARSAPRGRWRPAAATRCASGSCPKDRRRVRSSAWSVPSDVRGRDVPAFEAARALAAPHVPPSSTACFSSGPAKPQAFNAVLAGGRLRLLEDPRLELVDVAGGLSPLVAQARDELLAAPTLGLGRPPVRVAAWNAASRPAVPGGRRPTP